MLPLDTQYPVTDPTTIRPGCYNFCRHKSTGKKGCFNAGFENPQPTLTSYITVRPHHLERDKWWTAAEALGVADGKLPRI